MHKNNNTGARQKFIQKLSLGLYPISSFGITKHSYKICKDKKSKK